jgi:hypothetical protein
VVSLLAVLLLVGNWLPHSHEVRKVGELLFLRPLEEDTEGGLVDEIGMDWEWTKREKSVVFGTSRTVAGRAEAGGDVLFVDWEWVSDADSE